MNNTQRLIEDLKKINLSHEEAMLYVELLAGPNTHLQLARATGINRTKVYRLIEQLEKRSLVSRRTDDRGMFLVAHDPEALEISLLAEEEKIRHRREVLKRLTPTLQTFRVEASSPFVIHTYEGPEGLKQMAWHELKTKDELLVFGNSTFEEMVGDHRWSEKLREEVARRGYRTREIFNDPLKRPDFTNKENYMNLYEARRIDQDALPVATPMTIYNDTVEIYQFTEGKHVGVEIINAGFAATMRSIFNMYWQMADKLEE